MLLKERAVICRIDHVARRQDNIGQMDPFDAVHIFDISCNVRAVNVPDPIVLCVHDVKLSAL